MILSIIFLKVIKLLQANTVNEEYQFKNGGPNETTNSNLPEWDSNELQDTIPHFSGLKEIRAMNTLGLCLYENLLCVKKKGQATWKCGYQFSEIIICLQIMAS